MANRVRKRSGVHQPKPSLNCSIKFNRALKKKSYITARKVAATEKTAAGINRHLPTREVIILILILLIGGYFLITEGGITGALVGVSEAPVEQAVLQELDAAGQAAVIVILQESLEMVNEPSDTFDQEQEKKKIADSQEKVLGNLMLEQQQGLLGIKEQEFALDHQYETIPAISGLITKDGLKKLQQDYHVAEIRQDKPITLFLDDSAALISADRLHRLPFNQTLPINQTPSNSTTSNTVYFTGSGQAVCIVDTGIDYTHPAFGSCTTEQVISGQCRISGYNIAGNNSDPLDNNGHGTHVAGIVASDDPTYAGIAPGANLVAVKVFPDSSGTTTEAMVIAGIDWCIAHAADLSISAISLSLGDGSLNNGYCDDSSLAIAVNQAVDAGLLVSVASGNNGYSAGLSSPACASRVVAVGSTTKSDIIPSYSNSASILDVLAPGSAINSASLNGNFAARTGTSMAAPHVAGAAVLIKQYFSVVHGQTLNPAEIELKLKKGVTVTDSRNNLLFPRIDLYLAVAPKIVILSPEDNIFTNKNHLLLSFSSDVPLAEGLVSWNGANLTLAAVNSSHYLLNLTNISSGLNSYTVYARDAAGTVAASGERWFTVAPLLPLVEFNLADSYLREGILALNVTASSENNITWVQFMINQTGNVTGSASSLSSSNSMILPGLNLGNGLWMASLNISSLEEASWKITALASDSLGNINNSESRTLVIDRTAPLIANATASSEPLPVNSTVLYVNSTIKLQAVVSDSYLALAFVSSSHNGAWANYTLRAGNGSSANNTLTNTLANKGLVNNSFISNNNNNNNNNWHAYRINTTVVPGNHWYQIHAVDWAGNAANSSLIPFTIDNRAPANILFISPSSGSSFAKDSAITFSASAADQDGQELSYLWNFGDSGTAAGPGVIHAYGSNGNYTVTVTVSDGMASSSSSLQLQITGTAPENSSGDANNNSSGNSPDDDSDSSEDDSSSESSSGGGSSSGSSDGSSGGSTGESQSLDSTVFSGEEIESIEAEADSETDVEATETTTEVGEQATEPDAATLPASDEAKGWFSQNLVGAAVSDFINTRKAASWGIIIGLSLLISAVVTGLIIRIVRKRKELER